MDAFSSVTPEPVQKDRRTHSCKAFPLLPRKDLTEGQRSNGYSIMANNQLEQKKTEKNMVREGKRRRNEGRKNRIGSDFTTAGTVVLAFAQMPT